MHAQIKYRIRVKVIDRKRKREEERKRREKVQRSQYVHKYRLVFAECYFSSGCHLPASSFIAYRSPLTTHHSSFTGHTYKLSLESFACKTFYIHCYCYLPSLHRTVSFSFRHFFCDEARRLSSSYSNIPLQKYEPINLTKRNFCWLNF